MARLESSAGVFALAAIPQVDRASDADRKAGRTVPDGGASETGLLASLQAREQELLAEIHRLRTEREKHLERQADVMQLLGSKSPERIAHDLRNLINERELYKTLADLD